MQTKNPRDIALPLSTLAAVSPNLLPIIAMVKASKWPTTAVANNELIAPVPARAKSPSKPEANSEQHATTFRVRMRDISDGAADKR